VLWCPGAPGNGGGRPKANLLAVQTVCCMAEATTADQWSLLAFLMALNLADLAALAEARRAASNLSLLKVRRAEL